MKNFFSDEMSFKDYINVKVNTLVVFFNEYEKELKKGNKLFASMYKGSISNLISDLTTSVYDGKPQIDYVKEELNNRGTSLDNLIPKEQSADEEISL